MTRIHRQNYGIAAIALGLMLALGACLDSVDVSEEDTGSDNAFDFTDGDGIPELTEAPSFSPSVVSIGSNVTVSVSVDSDTTSVAISLGIYDSSTDLTTLTIFEPVTSVSPSNTNDISITVPSGAVAGDYVAKIDTCLDGVCIVASTGRMYIPFSVYQILNLFDSSFLTSTSVVPPSFTAQ